MDVLVLSRIQFAATVIFHFLFVPLTLGLSWLLAWWEITLRPDGRRDVSAGWPGSGASSS